jgi:hypothetical protein
LSALFPDVPLVSGVPSVLRAVSAAAGSPVNDWPNIAIGASQGLLSGTISNVQVLANSQLINGWAGQIPGLMLSDSPVVAGAANSSGQWGVFDKSNNLVLIPDSFKELSYRQAWKIANYPMEEGAFQSYNKVQTPFEVRLSMTKGGTDSDRAVFLQNTETIADTTDLFSIVTPEYTYLNVNVENINYNRTATNGAKLLTVELDLLEIRVTAQSPFSNTAQPSGAAQANYGSVQPQPYTPSLLITVQ